MGYLIRYRCVKWSESLEKDPNKLNEEQIQAWMDELRSMDEGVLGPLKSPSQHPDGPPIVVEQFSYGDKSNPLISWQHFAVDKDDKRHQLTWKPQRVDDHLVWLEEVAPQPKEHVPPDENLKNGYECQKCKQFSLQQGQEWLNQVTHRFDKAEDSMYRDILKMTTNKFDVEVPDSDKTFGRCAKHNRLVMATFPGCEQYSAKKDWKNVQQD